MPLRRARRIGLMCLTCVCKLHSAMLQHYATHTALSQYRTCVWKSHKIAEWRVRMRGT